MESAVAGAILKTVVGRLFEVLDKEYGKHKNLTQQVEHIRADLEMFDAAMADRVCAFSASGARSEGRRSTAVETLYSEEMLDLSHEVEDCIDRFIHRLLCKQLGAWPFRGLTKPAICSSFAGDIQKLRSRIKEAHQRVIAIPVPVPVPSTTSRRRRGDPCVPRGDVVGIGKAVEELVSLLHEVECEKEQLRVISVVGFGGLGKTTLARAVYDSPCAKERFPCRAWVAAGSRSSEIDGGGGVSWILREILRRVLPREKEVMDVDDSQRHLQAALRDYLEKHRYLIVIDDVRMEQWSTISAILKDSGKGSRVLVTTAIQSVANICSHGNGYVYHVKSLGKDDSKKIALPGAPSPQLEQGSAMLLQKCDGLPLALVSVSDYLKSSTESTVKQCGDLCRNLGSHLREEKHAPDNFADLREVLLDNYESLSSYAQACLLYLGVFRNDRPLKRKVVVRRWLAEGYARSDHSRSEEDIADENFKMLIDRDIIRSTDTSRNDAQVKTCRTHGIMHEFVLHKSVSRRFIAATSFDRPRAPYSVNARHLSIHGGDATFKYSGGAYGKKGLSRVRSVTLSGNNNAAADAISYVGMCKLLRVLDLEECSDLEDDHLKDIGKLMYLRYLSLGSSITKLPKSILGRLHCLETLDLRRTKINTLPKEALELPHLLHLFGRFMLEKDDLKSASKIMKLHKFLSEESNLQTLAGFDTDGEEGFLHFVGQMKKLRKMKIWCKPCGNGCYWTELSNAIQEFAKVPMVYAGNQGARSLSINSEECSGAVLSSIDFEACPDGFVYEMASLKLQGELLRGLPPFVTMLSGLTELCISSANTTLTRDLLSALIVLRCLLYLKLTAHQLESFELRNGALPSLERLCFVLQSPAPALPTMEQGALPNLVSLQLICPCLDGLSGMNIRHLQQLKEITIHAGVTGQTQQHWEGAAKNHPNRPTLKTVGETQEDEASSMRGKRRNCEMSSTDDFGLDSGIKKMRLSVSEPPRVQLADAVSSSYSVQR